MIPFPCRLLVWIASTIVPPAKRTEWRREWNAELWHRAEAGESFQELLRRSAGVFRDAWWMLGNELKRNPLDIFRRPLRTEALFLAGALAVCLLAGGFRAPSLPFSDPARLATLDRNVSGFAAFEAYVTPRLVGSLRQAQSFAGIAQYRMVPDRVPNVRASTNFFDVLGVKPAQGRTFTASDGDDVVVLTHSGWQRILSGNANPIGHRATLGGREYTVVGVMPRGFWFRSSKVQCFTPLHDGAKTRSLLARIKLGVAFPRALADLRQQAAKTEPAWLAKALVLTPMLDDRRLPDLRLALWLAALSGLIGMGYLAAKRYGGPRCWALLGARIALVVTAILYLRVSCATQSWSMFVFWIFLLLCCAAGCLLTIDHRGRCPVCFRKLRKPVSIGVWSSQILDQPATEYLCPAGHGTLYVSETGNAPDHWTVLDESWQDLFAHTED